MQDPATGFGAGEGMAQLSRSMERAMDQNRMLLEEMARFAKEESLRLAHVQLDQADHAFMRLRHSRDLSGLIDAQQDWMKQMMQEYVGLSLRYAEMFHRLAQHLKFQFGASQQEREDGGEAVGEELARMTPAGNGMAEAEALPAE
jgi:hypothetical protein